MEDHIIHPVTPEVPYGLVYREPSEELKQSEKYQKAIQMAEEHCMKAIESGEFMHFTEEDFIAFNNNIKSKLAESSTTGQ